MLPGHHFRAEHAAEVYRLDKPLSKIYMMLVDINRDDSICTGHRFLTNIHDVNPLASDSTQQFSWKFSKFKAKCN